MWYLYLDESGDFGFDFTNKNPSKFFTITILAVSSIDANRKIINAVNKTLRRKLNRKGKRSRIVQELKGTGTSINVKKYLFKELKDIRFGVYAVTLNKQRLFKELSCNKARVYNYIARQVIDKIPFERAVDIRIELIIDKSKGHDGISGFNQYIYQQLESRISINVPLDIYHRDSCESKGLQVCDMFCWGIFRKYERDDFEWFNIYKEKVVFDDVFLK